MITGRPRARHAHRRLPPPRVPLPPQRPGAHLTGGPLAGLTVHIDRDVHDAATMHVPGHTGHTGRYVRVDADEWAWETDHRGTDV